LIVWDVDWAKAEGRDRYIVQQLTDDCLSSDKVCGRISGLTPRNPVSAKNRWFGNQRYADRTLGERQSKPALWQRRGVSPEYASLVGSGEDQPPEVTGKVWCKSDTVPQL
jgi:hypothetical protein